MLVGRPASLEFDPVTSVNSGQTFLWEFIDGAWYGIDGRNVLKFAVSDGVAQFWSYPERGSWERNLFRLDDNIARVQAVLGRDPTIATFIAKYPGLRLLRQDPEQCLFSFVCASNTNIPMIRRMLYNLSRMFGDKIAVDGREFFTFPTAKSLNSASVSELLSCGVGYRARAIKAAAKAITDGDLNLPALRKAGLQEAKDQLLRIYGVGNKIADCILLFSLEKLDAFPIDVWIARSLSSHYSTLHECRISEKLTPRQYELISEKMRRHFGKYAGYAQQYMYYGMRHSARKPW
jgi:N-glycosylase/DNA lyase